MSKTTTSRMWFGTEDIRVGYASARVGDGVGAAKFPGTWFQCGFDGSISARGLLAFDLHDLDVAIPTSAQITAARFTDGALDAFVDTRFYVGTGNPWTLAPIDAWNAIANGGLAQDLSAAEMAALVDGNTGQATIPLGAAALTELQSALHGAGLFWLGMLNDETSGQTFRWSLEDPWPVIEIDWQPGGGHRRICLPPMPRRRRRRR